MYAQTKSLRTGVRELLSLLASGEQQLAYEHDVPGAVPGNGDPVSRPFRREPCRYPV
jgi:hypothetical protein